MREFDYLRPETVREASACLADHGEGCRIIAGGTALLLALRQRMVAPSHLVSLERIRALRGITYDETLGLRIGAMTLHAEVARSPLVRARFPMLADMAARLANPQVRNQGTIGGNICYADPATDPPTSLVALDATLVLESARGPRLLPIGEFLVDYYATALVQDEILVEIRIPPPRFERGYHARFHRTAAEHRPLVNMAVMMNTDGDVITDVRIVVGASTTVPARARRAETWLAGRAATAASIRETADMVAADIAPLSDIRGSDDYRREMVRVVARRTLARLCAPDAQQTAVA